MSSNVVPTISLCIAVLAAVSTWSETNDLTGNWILNEELTEELQPPIKKHRRAGGGIQGVLGGINVPTPGGGGAPAAGAASLKTPVVLDCGEMKLEKSGEKVTINCSNGLQREFNVGNLHGRRTKWNKTRLTESYSSTSRSVKHQIKLDRKGNLIATVTLQPSGGVAQKYVRAFNRKTEDSAEASVKEESEPNSS